ncbi:MAG: hypothetical protein ACQEQV_00135 [Fibrobacterota bacterium]
MRYKKRETPYDVRYYTFSEEKKPQRERIITHDDILNLRILLNTEKTMEAFLAKV